MKGIHIYPPNKPGDAWIAVKFGLAGPHSSIEAFGATEKLALSTLRLKLAGHWKVIELISGQSWTRCDSRRGCGFRESCLMPGLTML